MDKLQNLVYAENFLIHPDINTPKKENELFWYLKKRTEPDFYRMFSRDNPKGTILHAYQGYNTERDETLTIDESKVEEFNKERNKIFHLKLSEEKEDKKVKELAKSLGGRLVISYDLLYFFGIPFEAEFKDEISVSEMGKLHAQNISEYMESCFDTFSQEKMNFCNSYERLSSGIYTAKEFDTLFEKLEYIDPSLIDDNFPEPGDDDGSDEAPKHPADDPNGDLGRLLGGDDSESKQ